VIKLSRQIEVHLVISNFGGKTHPKGVAEKKGIGAEDNLHVEG
jgi:hypothetical protein